MGDNAKSQSYRALNLITGSLILEYNITRDVDISIQPGYARYGTIVSYEDRQSESGLKDSLSVHMNSLSLPLLLRVSTASKWFVNTGPVFWHTSDVSVQDVDTGEDLKFVDSYNTWDAGLIFGFGKVFQAEKFKPFFEFRIVWGVTNLVQDESSGIRVRHNGSQLVVGTTYTL